MATQGRIKGAAIRDFIAWYAREHDLERLKRAIRQLPEEAQAAFDFSHGTLGVLPSTWFAASDVHRVLDILTHGLSPAAYDALARDAGHATVQALMTGVQKIIFTTFMTPGAYSRLATMAFRSNYDAGSVSNEELGPRRHAGTVHGWTAHHPFLCRMHVSIKLEIYAAMGCDQARIERRFCAATAMSAAGRSSPGGSDRARSAGPPLPSPVSQHGPHDDGESSRQGADRDLASAPAFELQSPLGHRLAHLACVEHRMRSLHEQAT